MWLRAKRENEGYGAPVACDLVLELLIPRSSREPLSTKPTVGPEYLGVTLNLYKTKTIPPPKKNSNKSDLTRESEQGLKEVTHLSCRRLSTEPESGQIV